MPSSPDESARNDSAHNDSAHSDALPGDLDPVEASLLETIGGLDPASANVSVPLPRPLALQLFEAQIRSRLTDHTARWLRSTEGIGYYTIGSAGHESNAAVALGLRPSDPALLHYRSGGFYFGRAAQVDDGDPVGDVLRGMQAKVTEPISGGRHKVFGNEALGIIPQTSTIASHLPRAVGLATSLGWGPSPRPTWPRDAVVVCSFGDASLNHSTAQGAINWALNTSLRGQRVPVLFVCEDNGIGISTPTPLGWVEESTRYRPGWTWASADGDNPGSVVATTAALAQSIRSTGRPGFLHLRTVRYLGHAGTDVESAYRSPAEIRADLDRDPIVGTARELVASGAATGEQLVAWYLEEREAIRDRALAIVSEPELTDAESIMAPLAVRTGQSAQVASSILSECARDKALTVAQTINAVLRQAMNNDPRLVLFGEDVARKGGVYGVTRGLQSDFGERVIDTILDEQSVLGLALGAAVNGYVPLPEIQYLAYLHNAEDQLRGEGASLPFFSDGRFRNPMVVRIAAYAYQRGFGGHFHNDNSVAVLRDIPGIVIASPAHPADVGAVLATSIGLAASEGALVAFLEPIARYHTSDLLADGDGGWLAPVTEEPAELGRARTHGDGTDGTIITWGNGLFMSLRAQHQLAQLGQDWRVVDLRWLAPMPVADIVREADATGRTLVVDETRHSGGVGEGILATLVESGYDGLMDRVAARDSFVPLGAAADLVLVSESQILDHALALAES